MEDRMDCIIAASMSTLLSKGSIRLTALAAFRHSRIFRSMASLNFRNRRCKSIFATLRQVVLGGSVGVGHFQVSYSLPWVLMVWYWREFGEGCGTGRRF